MGGLGFIGVLEISVYLLIFGKFFEGGPEIIGICVVGFRVGLVFRVHLF